MTELPRGVLNEVFAAIERVPDMFHTQQSFYCVTMARSGNQGVVYQHGILSISWLYAIHVQRLTTPISFCTTSPPTLITTPYEMVNSRRLLLVLIAAAGAIKLVQSSCSVSGCQPDRCHCAPIVEPITLEAPSAAWSKQLKVVDDGCLANGGMIVCPLNDTAATIK